MICAEDKNECSAGFRRREIIAPADGVMVEAWNDIADNVSWEGADQKLFTEADGTATPSSSTTRTASSR